MFEVAVWFSSINFYNLFFFPFSQTLMNVRSIMVAAATIVTISLDHFIVAVRKEPVWVLTIWLVLVRNAKLSFSAYNYWRKILLLLRMEINNDHQGKTTDRSFKCIISVYFFIMSVPVNQYLYVRYSVESSADLVIMAVTCRATKTGSLYSWPQYSIILNGYVCYSNILVGMIFLEKIRKFQSSSRYFISPRFLSIKTSVCLRFVVPYLAKAKCKVWRLSVLLKDNFQRFTDSNGWTWTI